MNTNRLRFLLGLFLLPLTAAVNYTYDPAGRLALVDYGNGATIAYTYDKAGNMLSRVVSGTARAGPILDRHKTPLTRRFVVYYSAVYTSRAGLLRVSGCSHQHHYPALPDPTPEVFTGRLPYGHEAKVIRPRMS